MLKPRFLNYLTVLALCLFLWWTYLIWSDNTILISIDNTIMHFFANNTINQSISTNQFFDHFLYYLFYLVTMLGDPIVIWVLILLFFLSDCYFESKPLLGVWLVSNYLLGAAVLNYGVKQFFTRERPTLHRLIPIGGYSYPSGHSMGSFIFYLGLYIAINTLHHKLIAKKRLSSVDDNDSPFSNGNTFVVIFLKKIGYLMTTRFTFPLILLLIALIGFSRLYLGVHYFSDVIGGFILGTFWLSLWVRLLPTAQTTFKGR